MTLLTEKYSQNLVELFYLVGIFRTRSPGDSISVAEKTASRRQESKSGYIQVCSKGSRLSEHQRSGVKLRNVAFCMWEAAGLWARWVHPFHMLLSSPGAHPVSSFTLLLALPQLLSSHRGGWQYRWIQVLRALIHIWRPEIPGGCDISCLLIWQEIFSFHKVKNTCPPKAWRNALGVVIGKDFKTRQALIMPISGSKFTSHPLR